MPTYNPQQHDKGKNPEVDTDGFQQVKSRKNIRRNIFEKRPTDPRTYTEDLRSESPTRANAAAATAAAHGRNQRSVENMAEPEADHGRNAIPEGAMKGSCDLQGAASTPRGTDGRKQTQTAKKTQTTPIEANPLLNVEGTKTSVAAAKNNNQATDSNVEPNEGEDHVMLENEQNIDSTEPSSRNNTQKEGELTDHSGKSASMQWSPVKLAGTKRALEEDCEEEESSETSEDDREEGELSGDEEEEQDREEREPTSPRTNEAKIQHGSEPDEVATRPQTLQSNKEAETHVAREEGEMAEKTSALWSGDPGETVEPRRLIECEAAPNEREGRRVARSPDEARDGRQEDITVADRSRMQHSDLHRNGNRGPPVESEEASWVVEKLTRLPEGKAKSTTDTDKRSNQVRLPSREVTQHMDDIRATGRPVDMEVRRAEDTIKDTNPSYLPQAILPEVILETQFHQHTKDRGKFYNEIMASIGLDSPTSSTEERGNEDTYQEPGNQVAATPIRNSAANLMALGKHVFTPRQGRIWEFKGKSPLGG